jgi:dihydrofolate reductase
MRNVVLSMFMSLDGFIEGPDGEFVPPAWSDEMQKAWSDTGMAAAGVLLYGRKNYEFNAAFWQAMERDDAASEEDRAFAKLMNGLPKLVFSTTLETAEWNARLVKHDIPEEIERLKQKPGKDLVLLGGAGLANSFMKLGLIDEYRILLVPILLGSGKRLFEQGHERRPLELVGSQAVDTGAVILNYRPVSS